MKDNKEKHQIRISKELHNEIKARASIRGISLYSYIERVLTEQILKEKQYYEIKK